MKDDTTSSSEQMHENSRMIDFLKLTLKELEDAQGAPDAEAQQALRTLQEQMRHLEHAQHAQRTTSDDSLSQPNAAAPSDIEIASNIDRLDEQLGALESKLKDADGQVQQLLGHSTALWLDDGAQATGQDQPSSDRNQSANGPVHADDVDGPIQRRRAPGKNNADA